MVLTPLCPTRYAAMRQKDEEEGVGRGCSAPQMGCSAGPREHDGESGPSIICLLRDTDTWALFSNLFLTCPPSFLPSFLRSLRRLSSSQTLSTLNAPAPMGRWSIGHMRGSDSEVGRDTR